MARKEWWSVKEVAKRHQVHSTTVYRWIITGRLAASRRAGGRYLIHADDVDRIVQPCVAEGRPRQAGGGTTREEWRELGVSW